jgi:hypothetical protein
MQIKGPILYGPVRFEHRITFYSATWDLGCIQKCQRVHTPATMVVGTAAGQNQIFKVARIRASTIIGTETYAKPFPRRRRSWTSSGLRSGRSSPLRRQFSDQFSTPLDSARLDPVRHLTLDRLRPAWHLPPAAWPLRASGCARAPSGPCGSQWYRSEAAAPTSKITPRIAGSRSVSSRYTADDGEHDGHDYVNRPHVLL